MKLDLPYLNPEPDRYGNVRLYVRRHGRRIRLREPPGSPGFLEAYTGALDALAADRGPEGSERLTAAPRGSLGWLGAQYFGSAEFGELDPVSQRTRRAILEECFREPRKPGSRDLMGACPIALLSAAHVQVLRDRRTDKKGAANNRLKYLSAMFGWAIEARHMVRNPSRDVRPLGYESAGFRAWTVDDVRQFCARHPIGTKARLALALLLFTGARRGDLVTFGRQHVKNGWLKYTPKKTLYLQRKSRNRKPRISEKPIIPQLAEIIAASPTGGMTFLVTDYGRPFTAAGFGAWLRKRCDEAGLPQCSAHGLKKAGATIAAENGATDRQLMAMFDWSTASQANVYTEAASRKRLTGDAMLLLGTGS